MPPSAGEIWAALALGAVSSIGLIVGAIAGCLSRLSHHAIALAMSIGAGLLLGAASLELGADAVQIAGPMPAVVALLLGAGVFSAANGLLACFGAAHRKRCGECTPQASESLQPGSGAAIALGTALDAVPEVVVLGLALRQGPFPFELVIAISNILVLWSAIAMGAAVATAVGYVAFGSLDQSWSPRLQAFGAGALLATTAERMIPEAFHNSPRFLGFLAAIGFSIVLLVDAATP